ncbi:MAG: hypothetical protein CVU06_12995 [Bacteroidetes bacterium HGW-Bacteroidetes-22]|nr:MAG: hypothetical protein CVU06_12995 [Bacteroidetes bacterium HGW-Bacteroidetes-22]
MVWGYLYRRSSDSRRQHPSADQQRNLSGKPLEMNHCLPEIVPEKTRSARESAIAFLPDHADFEISPFGSGHINDTFLITSGALKRPVVLQRINHHIFPDVEALMRNIRLVTAHLEDKKEVYGYRILKFITTTSGKLLTGDPEQGYWRAMELVENSFTHNRLINQTQAFEAGKALGAFHAMFNDFDANRLTPTLPHFHHVGKRLAAFHTILEKADETRLRKSLDLISYTQEFAEKVQAIDRLTDSNQLPVRVVHNDPKVNNILFDASGKACCMIDLDTVMPGCILHDFGDAIRTSASLAEEDETDLSRCGIDIGLFESYLKGYLEKARTILTEKEISLIPASTQILTFTIGLRFLTDYLAGDAYYKINYPDHNLLRAKAQYAQAAAITVKLPEMQRIVLTLST